MITLKKAESVEEVDKILRDPELFDRISEDDVKDYETPFDGHQRYMMIMKDDLAIGVWNLYPLNSVTLNIHCNMLKDYREYNEEAGVLLFTWFLADCPKQYQKLNTEIPTIYASVYHYAKKFGFKDEGINRKSIKKSGELIDQWRLGITRNEVNDFL